MRSLDGTLCPRCGSGNTVETWDGSGPYGPASVLCASCGHHWEVQA